MQCINICGNQSISKYTEYHPGCISDLLRHRLNASTGWWCDLSVAKKDWKGVSVHSNAVRMVIFNSSCCLSEVQIAIQHNNQQCFQSIPRVWKRYKFDQVTCSYGEHLAGKVTKGLAWQLPCVVFNENSQKLGDYLSVTTTDIQHNRVLCTSHLASHLNVCTHVDHHKQLFAISRDNSHMMTALTN